MMFELQKILWACLAPLFSLLSLFGYVFLFFHVLRGHVELIVFSSVSLIVTVLYVLALGGLLHVGAVLLFYLGVGLFLAFLLIWIKKDPAVFKSILTPGIVLFILMTLLYGIVFRDARYFFWDEFSHWGLVTKQMLATHRLHDGQGPVTFAHYPPGSGLWQYFVCLNTTFSEGVTFLAQFILLISPLILLFRKVRYRQVHLLAGILLLLYFLLSGLGHGIANLYVDHLLGVYFGGILLACLAGDDSPGKTALLFPPLFCLPLIKEVGLFLGLCCSGFILIHRLIRAGAEGKKGLERRGRWLSLGLVLLVSAAPLLSGASWQLRLRALEIHPGEKVRALAWDEGDDSRDARRSLVRERFFDLVLHQKISKGRASLSFNEFSYSVRAAYGDRAGLSALGWALFFVLGVLPSVFAADMGKDRSGIVFALIFMVLVFILYSGILFYMYLVVFDDGPAVGMVSFLRYYHIVLLPMAMIMLGLYLPGWRADRGRGFTEMGQWIFLGLLALIYIFETPYLALGPHPRHSFREALSGSIRMIHERAGEGKRVYVVFQIRENGFYRVMLRYDLAPLRTTVSPPDLAAEGDGKLIDTIGEYDYLWCLAFDDRFYSRLMDLFRAAGARRHTFFRVERHGETVVLKPVF